MSNKTELVVIGAGPGGYTAAFLAADLGMQVTLIDLEKNPGGVCLYRGCIPSKAYLHVAKLLNEVKEASKWGIEFGEPKIDINKLRRFKEDVVNLKLWENQLRDLELLQALIQLQELLFQIPILEFHHQPFLLKELLNLRK